MSGGLQDPLLSGSWQGMKRSVQRIHVSCVIIFALLCSLFSFGATTLADDATPVVPEPEVPVATSVPEEIVAAAPIGGLTVEFLQCDDAARDGTTDFFFSGEFGAAASTTATRCFPVQYINGAAVQVTLNSDSQAYANLLNSSGMTSFGPEVEDGTYSVAVIAGEEYFGIMPSTIVLEPGGSYQLTVIRYLAPLFDFPAVVPGIGSIAATFARCINVERVGTIDVFIRVPFLLIQGAADSSECADPDPAPTTLRLSGTDVLGAAYSQDVVAVNSFDFLLVPYGTYTITDVALGITSAPFNLGGSNGPFFRALVYSYLQPPPTPTPTFTPEPTATNTPEPTATNTPEPTATNTPEPTATSTTTTEATWTPTEETPPTATSDPGEVNTLPNTGSGSANSSGLLAAMVVAAMSLLALAWRARTRS